ncbi:MAG: ATP phosphoribosyltransferase, partial [bacterium]|nr:ATP phosphoribosyltransferase [bacterium]
MPNSTADTVHRVPSTTARLRIAIPNKGRLADSALALLKRIGLAFEETDRKLSAEVFNFPAELLFASAKNIPEYVQDGAVDIGITGLDLVREQEVTVTVLEELGFGHTDLVVAVPTHADTHDVRALRGKRIATVFPNLTRTFFAKRKIPVTLVEVSGAVEITPSIGLADAIADLTSSGSTLRMNDLRPIETILESEAVLIGRKRPRKEIADTQATLQRRFRNVLLAEQKRYLMMNAPRKLLPKIKTVAPGLSAPT